jgi:hypothetical protein
MGVSWQEWVELHPVLVLMGMFALLAFLWHRSGG